MSKRQPPELVYDNLVIGSSLEAVLFAYYSNTKIIWTRNQQPLKVEQIKDFGYGTNKADIWSKHAFLLGLGGFIPFQNGVLSIRYIDASSLTVVSPESTTYSIKFNKLWVFDDHNIYDIPNPIGEINERKFVYDTFNMQCLGGFDPNYTFDRDSDFIRSIKFYTKLRTPLCRVESIVDDIEKIPDYLVRVKLTELFKQAGFTFKSNTVIEHVERQIVDHSKNLYTDFDNVMFYDGDLETMHAFGTGNRYTNYLKYLKAKMRIK